MLTLLILMSNSQQNSYVLDLYLQKIPIAAETSHLSFWFHSGCPIMISWHTFWQFYVKNPAVATPCHPPPLLLSFTVVSDHPKVGDLPTHCVCSRSFSWSRTKQGAVSGGSTDGSALWLFLRGPMVAGNSGQSSKTMVLYYKHSKY
jgi:hypothetical protein